MFPLNVISSNTNAAVSQPHLSCAKQLTPLEQDEYNKKKELLEQKGHKMPQPEDLPQAMNIEMYPQKRQTEYYRTPLPDVEMQSRCAEHPKDLEEAKQKSYDDGPIFVRRIVPANTITMGNWRESHYS